MSRLQPTTLLDDVDNNVTLTSRRSNVTSTTVIATRPQSELTTPADVAMTSSSTSELSDSCSDANTTATSAYHSKSRGSRDEDVRKLFNA